MNKVLRNRFPLFRDEASLRAAIESVCAEFGTVAQLTILRVQPRSESRCACFLRLDSEAAEQKLKGVLAIERYADELAFLADVHPDWGGPCI